MPSLEISPKLKTQAKNLHLGEFPRSCHVKLAGYVHAARMLDKCRATLNGTNGEYNFDSPLDGILFEFMEIDAEAFKSYVATGVTDEEVAAWIQEHAKVREPIEIIKWNNDWRYKRISEMSDKAQFFIEQYIEENIPEHRRVYTFFDIFDIEEGRL